MDNFYIAATSTSPEVDFRFSENSLAIKGESYPENAAAFYAPIVQQLRDYLATTDATLITADIALAYFNSSSTKMLFNLIEALSNAAEDGNQVRLNWYHDEEDDTILEFGQELSEDFPAIEFVTRAVGAA